MACEEYHMSIGEAVRCGCAKKIHTELWDVDIVGMPHLFRSGDDVTAVAAYMSTKTTNRVPHPVVRGQTNVPRFLTVWCSVRIMGYMASGMGHPSDMHLYAGIATGLAVSSASCYAANYSGSVTGFRKSKSENQVATVETPHCRKSNIREVPHVRFPGAPDESKVEFSNNRFIVTMCKSMENAISVSRAVDETLDVPLGYNPSRWQAVVAAHDTFVRALRMDHTIGNLTWEAYVDKIITSVVSKHRARGVCISRPEMRSLLDEMSLSMTQQAPELTQDQLDDICRKYSTTRPRVRSVPASLVELTAGAMRNRRTIMCHSRIPCS